MQDKIRKIIETSVVTKQKIQQDETLLASISKVADIITDRKAHV